jgi:restriction endonuclease S subunit
LDEEVDKYLMKELWIEVEEKIKKKFFCVGYKELGRWNVDNFFWSWYKSKYQELKMKDISNLIHRWKSPKYDDNWIYIAVSQKCVWNIDFDLSRSKNWNTEDAEKLDKKLLLQKNDILINSTWEWTIWRVCIIDKDYEKCITDSHVTTLRVNKNLVLPFFVVYYLNTKHWQTKLSDCFSWWTKQKELTKWKFELISFPVPPLKTQENIIVWVKQIKEKIKLSQEKIEKLKVDLDKKIKEMVLENKYL